MGVMEFVRLVPFPVEAVLGLDRDGAETLAIVVKATYAIQRGAAVPADEQDPIRLGDAYSGDPGVSSIAHAGDGALFKPAADVLLTGFAYPDKPRAREVDVTLAVGAMRRTVRVFGDRVWKRNLVGLQPGTPEPIERVPLVWERAFGGTDVEGGGAEDRNPVGVGFRAKGSKLTLADTPLPNLEDPRDLVRGTRDRPAPAGFGPIAPAWAPRRGYAGTYGDAWTETRSPMLPDDYDPRFQQVAPPEQVLDGYLRGGEPVEVLNATRGGRLACTLPRPDVTVTCAIGEERRDVPLLMDTLVVDAEAERLVLTLRGSTPVQGRVYDVEWIRVGPAGGGAR